ncbi:putative glycine--tRNA ligase [Helianthus annuus]|nr:putative glycine--tRNA ligase [Helianthus annuus]
MESAQLAVEIILVSSRSSLADYSLDFGTPWGCSCSFCICWRILSGNISHGLRNTSSATTLIDNSESYTNVMQQAGISQRKKIIVERANYLAKGVDRCLVMQSNLLDEVVNLVEAPVPVLGKFSESFLVLPKDLLVMVMQKHQKHFALTDTNRSLLPYFIAVANGAIIESIVRKGNEALDMKMLSSFMNWTLVKGFRSSGEKLGTMEDKMIRVESTVSELGSALGLSEDKLQIVREATSLAMSDLSAAVVTGFTSLSGIMACHHYALREGYSQQVSDALFEITSSMDKTLGESYNIRTGHRLQIFSPSQQH